MWMSVNSFKESVSISVWILSAVLSVDVQGEESSTQIKARALVSIIHYCMNESASWLACSQTLYFLFKVRRARRVIKYKPEGIYWPPAQVGSGGVKERKGKIRRILCSDWLPERAKWANLARSGFFRWFSVVFVYFNVASEILPEILVINRLERTISVRSDGTLWTTFYRPGHFVGPTEMFPSIWQSWWPQHPSFVSCLQEQ